MNEEQNYLLRLERFERTVATCLSTLPFLFAGQCLWVALGSKTQERMFADFGSELPFATQLALSGRIYWVIIAIVVPLSAIVISRKKSAVFSVIFTTIAGLALFALGQFLTAAMFLPLAQLGTVGSGH